MSVENGQEYFGEGAIGRVADGLIRKLSDSAKEACGEEQRATAGQITVPFAKSAPVTPLCPYISA